MARSFNGTSDVIGLPIDALLRPSLPVSIHCWAKPSSLAASGLFQNNKNDLTHKGVWLNVADSSGHIESGFGDNDGGSVSSSRRSKVSTGAITSGVWNAVGCSIEAATTQAVYINGTDATGSYSGSGDVLAYNVGVGGKIGFSGGSYFPGSIAEVGFWNVALTAAEFAALGKGTSPLLIRRSALIAYWPVYGVADPEADLAGLALNSTAITGTSLANHAPVGMPVPLPT